MLKKTAQQSLLDLLMRMMPELQDGKGGPIMLMIDRRPTVNKQAVKALMSMWKNEDASVAYRKFKRPTDITSAEIDLMVKENLVKETGSELEITAKGVEVIKTTILGDERSVYEDDGKSLDYEVALANTKPKRKMIKGAKRAFKETSGGGNWYHQNVKLAASDDVVREAIGMLINWGSNNIGQVTHIIAYAQSAIKQGPPSDQNLVRAFEILDKVSKSKTLDELKLLAKEAQSVWA